MRASPPSGVVVACLLALSSLLGSVPTPAFSIEPSAVVGLEVAKFAGQAPASRFDRGTLWQVRHPDGAVSHLFGTMHARGMDELAPPPSLRRLLRASERLLVELGPSEAAPEVIALAVSGVQRLPARPYLSPREWSALLRATRGLGIDESLLRQQHPWFLGSMVLFGRNSSAATLDDWLLREARGAGLQVLGIETAMEQVAVIGCVPFEAHAALLREALRMSVRQRRAIAAEAIALYRVQEVFKALQHLHASFPRDLRNRDSDAALTRCLLDDRNALWEPRLRELLSQHGQFVAVGAGHLVGLNGLLARLERVGFEITGPIE